MLQAAPHQQQVVFEEAETKFVEVNGVRIAFRETGVGEPLILLQRYRGAMDDWDPGFLNPLATNHRVLVFDSAGVGESSGTTSDSLEEAADVAVAFLQALGIPRADVAGWSMGGMTAQIIAAKYPDFVRKLILIGTLPPGGTSEALPAPDKWAGIAAKPTYTSEDILYLFFSESPEGRAAGEASLKRTSFRRQATEMKTTPQTLQAHTKAIASFYKNKGHWYEKLKQIKAPTLIVNGDKDLAFAAINSVILGREISGAQVALYPDSGHGSHFQYPDRVSGDILTFLSR